MPGVYVFVGLNMFVVLMLTARFSTDFLSVEADTECTRVDTTVVAGVVMFNECSTKTKAYIPSAYKSTDIFVFMNLFSEGPF